MVVPAHELQEVDPGRQLVAGVDVRIVSEVEDLSSSCSCSVVKVVRILRLPFFPSGGGSKLG